MKILKNLFLFFLLLDNKLLIAVESIDFLPEEIKESKIIPFLDFKEQMRFALTNKNNFKRAPSIPGYKRPRNKTEKLKDQLAYLGTVLCKSTHFCCMSIGMSSLLLGGTLQKLSEETFLCALNTLFLRSDTDTICHCPDYKRLGENISLIGGTALLTSAIIANTL